MFPTQSNHVMVQGLGIRVGVWWIVIARNRRRSCVLGGAFARFVVSPIGHPACSLSNIPQETCIYPPKNHARATTKKKKKKKKKKKTKLTLYLFLGEGSDRFFFGCGASRAL